MAELEVTEQITDLTVNTTDEDDVVDPWTVTSKSEKGIDYDKLISEYIITFTFVMSVHL